MSNFSVAVDAIIKSEMDGHPRHELVLDLGMTPEYLQQYAKFPPINLVITGSVIAKGCFDHGIKTSQLKRLPEIIQQPKSVFASASQKNDGSVVIVTFEIHKVEIPVIIPIRPNRRFGRSETYNAITSIYGKEGFDPEVKWSREGLLLWRPSAK
jgi:hypothetical protein